MMAKYLLLSLNFGFIEGARFRRAFGQEFTTVYERELAYARRHKFLRQKGGVFYVREGRFHNMPLIRSLFYSERAITWLQRNITNSPL